ncbi:hypothetical protein Pelsub_P2773 [Pelolinea submarina]|nr:hypothetical protein Pelsub_P2773 [Pelolinea submarina]
MFACVLILLFASLACTIDFGGSSDAQETLTAIYLQETLDAQSMAEAAPPQEEAVAEPTLTVEVVHAITPGNPGWVSQWWQDTDSSGTASQNRASGGDYLNQNLLERPFTAQDMTYRQDVDLGKVEISQDNTFYYFLLHLDGVHSQSGMLSAFYGVELDLDKDGRGDLLLWARGDGNTTWNIEDVFVYSDENNDVGGLRAMLADAPSSGLNGYEKALFSPENLGDPDAAWKRVDPSDSSVMQLAIKKSLMSNASTFMWSAWADDGVIDPGKFDYNDQFTLNQAGSPLSGAADYPLKAIFLADNTCRLAYGYEETSDASWLCRRAEPTPQPTVPEPEEEEEEPPCTCPSNRTFITDKACCEYCGFTWGDNDEFPCY